MGTHETLILFEAEWPKIGHVISGLQSQLKSRSSICIYIYIYLGLKSVSTRVHSKIGTVKIYITTVTGFMGGGKVRLRPTLLVLTETLFSSSLLNHIKKRSRPSLLLNL